MAFLTLKDVNKQDGNRISSLRSFSLAAEQGELTVLAGPDGCGRSDVLRMIAGLEEISSGEIRMNGVRVDGRDVRERDVAMLFSNWALYPAMTVEENLESGLRFQQMTAEERKERVRETAELLKLTQVLDEKPSALSEVLKLRTAVGRAAVKHPALLLLDEPVPVRNEKLKAELEEMLSCLREKKGMTVLYATASPNGIPESTDRLVILREGAVEQSGSPAEAAAHPVSEFVEEFLKDRK